jgi:sec-independent protein translocase protein TatB
MGKTVMLGGTILDMFNVGGGEIFMILLLALLLLGPEKLPETARKVGKFMAEVRRVTSGFEEEVRSAMDIGQSHTVDNALDRTTEGPRLVAPVDPVTPATTTGSPTAFVADLSAEIVDTDDTTST